MPIDTSITVTPAPDGDATLLAVPYDGELSPRAPELPVPAAGLLAHHRAKGEAGEIVEAPFARGDTVGRVLLYGVGDRGPAALRKAGAALARRVRGYDKLSVVLPDGGPVGHLVEGALLACYSFRMGETPETSKAVAAIEFTHKDVREDTRREVRRGETMARAVALARDLANTPSSIKTPMWLADAARDRGLPVRVWDRAALAAEGFGGILAVGRGSAREPCLIQLSYEPDDPDGRHVVLVGKGITFDSGGLSLKPNDNMKLQKTDMAGGAVVIAVMGALREAGVRARVTGLVAAAENMPSGSAQRPSDVITQYGGRTVEVLNTDAEGRLVLADALAYADARLNPDVVVDIATLTGAITVALGRDVGAVYANDDELAAALVEAGRVSGDQVWRMPLIEDYAPALKSPVADLANVESGARYGAGSITAALFLREFAGKRPWAHLDIAGVGRSTVDEGIRTKGATGYGVRLLLSWLSQRA